MDIWAKTIEYKNHLVLVNKDINDENKACIKVSVYKQNLGMLSINFVLETDSGVDDLFNYLTNQSNKSVENLAEYIDSLFEQFGNNHE